MLGNQLSNIILCWLRCSVCRSAASTVAYITSTVVSYMKIISFADCALRECRQIDKLFLPPVHWL